MAILRSAPLTQRPALVLSLPIHGKYSRMIEWRGEIAARRVPQVMRNAVARRQPTTESLGELPGTSLRRHHIPNHARASQRQFQPVAERDTECVMCEHVSQSRRGSVPSVGDPIHFLHFQTSKLKRGGEGMYGETGCVLFSGDTFLFDGKGDLAINNQGDGAIMPNEP